MTILIFPGFRGAATAGPSVGQFDAGSSISCGSAVRSASGPRKTPSCRCRISRGGIAWIISKYQAQIDNPQLTDADVSPHTLRHSKAMHLYEAGIPLPYIRDILGHVDLSTTEIYARASTEAKRRALEAVYVDIVSDDLPEWNQDAGLLDWLAAL